MVGKLSKCMNDSVEIICIKSENFTENFIDEKDFFFFFFGQECFNDVSHALV